MGDSSSLPHHGCGPFGIRRTDQAYTIFFQSLIRRTDGSAFLCPFAVVDFLIRDSFTVLLSCGMTVPAPAVPDELQSDPPFLPPEPTFPRDWVRDKIYLACVV